MTSPAATVSLELTNRVRNRTQPLLRYTKSGLPVEGQVPKSFQPVAAAAELNTFYEFTNGTNVAITIGAATAKNMIGGHFVIYSTGAGTVTLGGGLNWFGLGSASAYTIATFTGSVNGFLEVFVAPGGAGSSFATPQVWVIADQHVTFS